MHPVIDKRQHHGTIYVYTHVVLLHVHYYTSMQVLHLFGLHATAPGAGLQCIHACHAGVHTTGQHHLGDACALQAGMYTPS